MASAPVGSLGVLVVARRARAMEAARATQRAKRTLSPTLDLSLFSAFFDDLEVVVEDGGDDRNHVCFNHAGADSL